MLCEPPAAAPRHSLSHVRAPAFTRTRTRKHTHALHSARTHRRTTSGGAVCVCASVGAWASAPGSVHALDELMDSSVSGFCQASSQASAATFTAGASAPACMRWGAHAHACMHACMLVCACIIVCMPRVRECVHAYSTHSRGVCGCSRAGPGQRLCGLPGSVWPARFACSRGAVCIDTRAPSII